MSQPGSDRVLGTILGLTAILAGSAIVAIVVFVAAGAAPAFSDPGIARLFTDTNWQPGSEREPQFAIGTLLAGSVLVTGLSLVLAVPVGVGCAIFQRFYAGGLANRLLRRILELLAGIPSVVIGFWGLTVLVPWIQRIHPPGQSLLAGGLVLAVMIIPTIALTARSALERIPRDYFEAAAALGLGRGRTITSVALPVARGGIGAGVLLALARAIGETMAVVMVCGNLPQIPASLFDPIRPVTSTIALEMGYATSGHQAVLFAAALILILLVGAAVGWLAFAKPSGHRNPAI